jgi:fumarate reductase flavoprotein subunit
MDAQRGWMPGSLTLPKTRIRRFDMKEKKNPISRRDFLKGAAVSATAVAGGAMMASCAPKVEEAAVTATEAAQAAGTVPPSFMPAPEPIAAGDIKETVSADIVVVGAGVAGLMATLTAA